MLQCILIFLISFSHLMAHSMPTIHTVGDSHAFCSFKRALILRNDPYLTRSFNYEFSHNGQILSLPFHLIWKGSHTMHRIGRDGLEFLNIKRYGVQENDCIVFVFGEIDVRCHIIKQSELQKISVDEVITRLADAYVATIINNKQQYNNLHCVIFSVLPPTNRTFNPQVPYYGSLEERILVTKKLNAYLELLCRQHNLLFLNMYDVFATEKGDFKDELSDGNVHIGPHYTGLTREGLAKLLIANNII